MVFWCLRIPGRCRFVTPRCERIAAIEAFVVTLCSARFSGARPFRPRAATLLYSHPATERSDAWISIRPRVLRLARIALIFVNAQEQRTRVAVMRSLSAGADTEEHAVCWRSDNVVDLKTATPPSGSCFSKGEITRCECSRFVLRGMSIGDFVLVYLRRWRPLLRLVLRHRRRACRADRRSPVRRQRGRTGS
jgi:hypothetical protein